MKNKFRLIKSDITKEELRIIMNLNPQELFLGFICINKCAIPENYEIRNNFIEQYDVKNFKHLSDENRVKKLTAMLEVYYEIYFKDKIN